MTKKKQSSFLYIIKCFFFFVFFGCTIDFIYIYIYDNCTYQKSTRSFLQHLFIVAQLLHQNYCLYWHAELARPQFQKIFFHYILVLGDTEKIVKWTKSNFYGYTATQTLFVSRTSFLRNAKYDLKKCSCAL